MSASTAARWFLGVTVGLTALVLVASLPAVLRLSKHRYPGVERADLDSLDPVFAACVGELMQDLRAAGYRPVVYGGWRDAERQRHYQEQGWSKLKAGGPHGRSVDGRPAAYAVDIVDGAPFALGWRHIGFFRELGAQCEVVGLECGVNWSRRNPVLAHWDLGWDPAHVEFAGRCG